MFCFHTSPHVQSYHLSSIQQALTELYASPDAVGVALLFGGIDESEDVLAFLQVRREAMRGELASVIAERERLQGAGLLAPLDVAVFRRRKFLRAAELAWLDEVEQQLTAPDALAQGNKEE